MQYSTGPSRSNSSVPMPVVVPCLCLSFVGWERPIQSRPQKNHHHHQQRLTDSYPSGPSPLSPALQPKPKPHAPCPKPVEAKKLELA